MNAKIRDIPYYDEVLNYFLEDYRRIATANLNLRMISEYITWYLSPVFLKKFICNDFKNQFSLPNLDTLKFTLSNLEVHLQYFYYSTDNQFDNANFNILIYQENKLLGTFRSWMTSLGISSDSIDISGFSELDESDVARIFLCAIIGCREIFNEYGYSRN